MKMNIEILKSKLHKATVTGTSKDYVGSITIDEKLMAATGLIVHEKVLVANINNGSRLWTYVISGGPGQIELNGAAANHASLGDKVIIMSFASMTETEAVSYEPTIVILEKDNKPVD